MKLHFVCCILEFIGKIRQHKYWLIGVLVVSTLASLIAAKFIFSQTLTSYQDGDALIIADQNHVAVKVVASDKEHPLITTDPTELYA